MECLWCDREMIPEISWKNLFQGEKKRILCEMCEGKLQKLIGNRCKRCSRMTVAPTCADCKRWERQGEMDSIKWNYSIFGYNTFMQDVIAKWKYRGDYLLGNVFKEYVIQAFKENFAQLGKDVVAVPIPLSTEREKERSFNQAKMLAQFLPIEMMDVMSRIHGEKQSKKTRIERIGGQNPFFISERVNKSVILVDDIYTTGTTLRHAATTLKASGSSTVYSLTLIRG
ncbi:ComF family protein [Oceanobacillus bengalensis]|uniref:ComF family protein n=1 Tax=Oceanobacillus bengalensis TaxID=1435466 RepID=A0A494Z6N5_9BACI|nr:ComF family protein [Oceanobacillus bengalensis]RKQ18213.1 ComF family protein [Oceanobacillus bengalensis]